MKKLINVHPFHYDLKKFHDITMFDSLQFGIHLCLGTDHLFVKGNASRNSNLISNEVPHLIGLRLDWSSRADALITFG